MGTLPSWRLVLAAVLLTGLMPAVSGADQTSDLWGTAGGKWTPESRLPDFSQAGYRRGEEPYRLPTKTVSVKDFGAAGGAAKQDKAILVKSANSC